ncbi:MAG: glycosyltransferase family 2 protein [Planctomycetota bacterium]
MIGGKSVSSFVITYNEQSNIRDCLESVKWVDELVVVDSFSEDDTVEIARRYTDNIIQREFPGHVAQTRFAMAQTTSDWVLWLDADERLTPEAVEQVKAHLEGMAGAEYAGFAFPRKTYFLDRWITHSGWYPQHKLRLALRQAARIEGSDPHPELVVEGRVKRLTGDILHLSFPGGIVDYAQRSGAYAAIAARARFARGRRPSLFRLLLEPPLSLVKSYLLQLGILDGVPGLAIAVGTAYHRFVREVRLRELTREHAAGSE